MTRSSSRKKDVIGWREWITLPELGGVRIKAKIDTGARTSAIHAFHQEYFERDGQRFARFELAPNQDDGKHRVPCEAVVIDHREIKSSTGHTQHRDIIRTTAQLGDHSWPIELSLTTRDEMGFRMLLGRAAVRGRFYVDPGRSFVFGVASKV
jgi:hypothetical protein